MTGPFFILSVLVYHFVLNLCSGYRTGFFLSLKIVLYCYLYISPKINRFFFLIKIMYSSFSRQTGFQFSVLRMTRLKWFYWSSGIVYQIVQTVSKSIISVSIPVRALRYVCYNIRVVRISFEILIVLIVLHSTFMLLNFACNAFLYFQLLLQRVLCVPA